MLRRFIAALSVFMALAWHVPASAQTALQAPSIKWQGQWGTTQPVSFIGYDTGTGLPCIVGSSATCTITTTAGAGGSTVYGPTANGSPATSPPVLVGGTANGTGTGNVTNWKIDTSGVGFVQFVSAQPVTATEADGANVTLGAKADAANCATANSLIACIRQLHADMIAATPAGSAIIGKVGIDQTSNASTNNVTVDGVQDGITTTASVTSATTALTFTTAGYGYIAFGFTSIGSGNTVVVEGAADGSTFTQVSTIFGSTGTNATSITPTTGTMYYVPVVAQTMRVRVSVYGSGTVTVFGTPKRGQVPPFGTVNVTTLTGGGVASGAADSGNPNKVGGVYNSTLPTFSTGQRGDAQIGARGSLHTELWASDAGVSIGSLVASDGASNSTTTLAVSNRNSVYNGTTWDRVYSATAATATTGTGVPAAGMMGRFNTSPGTLTDTQYGVAQMSSKGELFVNLSNNGTTINMVSADASSNVTGPVVNSVGRLFNNSTEDRARSIQGAKPQNTGIGVTAVEEAGRPFTHISTNATTTALSGAGFLHTICVNTKGASANTATIYDNTVGSGTIIAVLDTTAQVGCMTYDAAVTTGVTIVTATGTAADLTVTTR